MTSVSTSSPVVPESSWPGERPAPDGRWRGVRRRRSLPHLLLGVLLVLVCAVGFLLVVLDTGGKRPVLALARPVTVGHVLTGQDVRRVDVGAGAEVGLVGAGEAAAVVGRPVTTSLPAGTLLSAAMVGSPLLPGPGQAVVAAAVRPGQVPPEVTAGSPVLAVSVPTAPVGGGTAAAPAGEWPGVVTAVEAGQNDQYTLVSLLMARDAAREVAALPPGQVSIVLLPGGTG